MNLLIKYIALIAVAILFSQCEKQRKCKGISPELTEDERKWLSTLQVNDSLMLENNKGQIKTYYVTEKSFGKVLDKDRTVKIGVKGPPCADQDSPFGSIYYAKIKNPVVYADGFFGLGIIKDYDAELVISGHLDFGDYTNTFASFPKILGGSLLNKELGAFEVNGIMYPEVYYYEADISEFKPENRVVHKIYYSRSAGLVRFDLSDGETWLRKIN